MNPPAIGSDKRLWEGECCNSSGHMFAITDGAKLTTYTLPNSNEQPNQTTLGPDKNIWYTSNSNAIGKITPKGIPTEYPIDFNASAVVTGSDGRMWFGSNSSPEIGRIDTDGASASYFTRGITGTPRYMVLGPDKNIYFSEYDSGTQQAAIAKITPSGTVTEYALPYGFNPYGLVVGPDSNIWTIDGSHDQLGQLVISSSSSG
jgi:virginiamycin B lyase